MVSEMSGCHRKGTCWSVWGADNILYMYIAILLDVGGIQDRFLFDGHFSSQFF